MSASPSKRPDRPSVLTRIRNRFRYGLATQEVLDTLSRRLGLVIYPYYVVLERLSPGAAPATGSDHDCEARALTEDCMARVAQMDTRTRPPDEFVGRLRRGDRAIGFFVDDNLAGYSWASFERVPVPALPATLFELHDGEAYLFNAFVSPTYRGRRLAAQVRYRAYQDLHTLGCDTLYSLTMAFNASSRRFKRRLHARELELRLLLGIRGWRGIDFRLRAFSDRLRTPRFLRVGRDGARTPATV